MEKVKLYAIAMPNTTFFRQSFNEEILEIVCVDVGNEINIFKVNLCIYVLNIHKNRNNINGRIFSNIILLLGGKAVVADINRGVQKLKNKAAINRLFSCNNQ